ncbi:hypothetical protein L798_13534 [Zootermopsis nevadensis]|uniref:Uncharacterized protein n=1 Tax=Zootermopsis nevadensis TaxID=136037 RepID=A0A067QTK7_ZOONE|nr:hypothetical protein L798_13534 [Zootermopsis nevadensis]
MDLTEMTVDDADWIHLTANKSIAMTLVNTVMNILMSYETTSFFSQTARLSASQIGLCCVKLGACVRLVHTTTSVFPSAPMRRKINSEGTEFRSLDLGLTYIH